MSSGNYNETVNITMNYYNSHDADGFYYNIWGGEDVHIGMYLKPTEAISTASHRTVEMMMACIQNPGANLNILDIGGGYGGPARAIVKLLGHRVTVLNLSETQNNRNKELNRNQGINNIEIISGNFEDIPYNNDQFDIVWSQDAILHSNNRGTVLKEVYRVLKSGGEFIFSDPMRSNSTDNKELQPILDRIHLNSLSCPMEYLSISKQIGFIEQYFFDFGKKLPLHYQRVLEETERRESELINIHEISTEFIGNMKTGLSHWINGGRDGKLAWGIFHFTK